MISSLKRPATSNEGLVRPCVILNAASVILAASGMPTVSAANCWMDDFGVRHCGLSVGARIAIAVCIVVALLVLLIAIFVIRRRRINRANQAFVYAQQQQPQPQGAYGYPYGNNQYQYGNTPYDPTYNTAQFQGYPPQGQEYYNQQAPQANYAPPSGAPPNYQEYSAPRSPPPAAAGKV